MAPHSLRRFQLVRFRGLSQPIGDTLADFVNYTARERIDNAAQPLSSFAVMGTPLSASSSERLVATARNDSGQACPPPAPAPANDAGNNAGARAAPRAPAPTASRGGMAITVTDPGGLTWSGFR